jgi:hypothetical protein
VRTGWRALSAFGTYGGRRIVECPVLGAFGAARRWRPACRIEQAYGRWLGFFHRNGMLDLSTTPERATAARLSAFVAGLRERLAPVSATMMVGTLHRMLMVLEPEQDWAGLAGSTTASNGPRRRRATSFPAWSPPRSCSIWASG